MDKIIAKISEIEAHSHQIMDDANKKKAEIANEINDQTKAFDARLDTETEKKLTDLKTRLEQEMKNKLAKQQNAADKILNVLEDHYNKNREAYIDKLFSDMIKE